MQFAIIYNFSSALGTEAELGDYVKKAAAALTNEEVQLNKN